VSLSSEYKLVDSLNTLGTIPSLVAASSITIGGPVHFEDGVVITGSAEFHNEPEVPAGHYGS
jgi:hypothetical protein